MLIRSSTRSSKQFCVTIVGALLRPHVSHVCKSVAAQQAGAIAVIVVDTSPSASPLVMLGEKDYKLLEGAPCSSFFLLERAENFIAAQKRAHCVMCSLVSADGAQVTIPTLGVSAGDGETLLAGSSIVSCKFDNALQP
eukprot:SAG11_NODE_2990_length_2786_cov_4.823570_1_plen_138_part_00